MASPCALRSPSASRNSHTELGFASGDERPDVVDPDLAAIDMQEASFSSSPTARRPWFRRSMSPPGRGRRRVRPAPGPPRAEPHGQLLRLRSIQPAIEPSSGARNRGPPRRPARPRRAPGGSRPALSSRRHLLELIDEDERVARGDRPRRTAASASRPAFERTSGERVGDDREGPAAEHRRGRHALEMASGRGLARRSSASARGARPAVGRGDPLRRASPAACSSP